MCANPCQSCGNCQCTCANTLGCLDIYDTSCITYDGLALSCLGVETNSPLNDLLLSANSKLCDLIQNKGRIKVDEGDTCPKSLIDKLQAGANVILTGVGTGCNRQLRIDAILGGQTIDEKIKISPTDVSAGYLESKLLVGDCLNIQKVNAGFDEKLRVSIDWNCVLSKITSLAGFCAQVSSCVGDVVTTCPSISLNSPSVAGSDVTVTWVSTGTQFNVYLDGNLQPGMPVGTNSYTFTSLTDGTHTIQVSVVCTNGSSNSATTSVVINTTCPTASALNVNISSGNANLTWTPAIGVNVVDQRVEYRVRGIAAWTISATVASGINNHNISGILVNEVYEFRILTNCSTGGPTPSPITSKIQLTCPTVTLSTTNNSIQYAFNNVGGDVTQYIIELLNNTGTSVLQVKTENSPFATTITNSFTGLDVGTSYQVRISVVAQEFTHICPAQAISTSVPPSCPEPTGMTGTIN